MLDRMTKRKLTQAAVNQITHSGAPAASKGKTASCALPAYTVKDTKMAIGTEMPALTMATPVTSAQAAMPTEVPDMSTTPARKLGCCMARWSCCRVMQPPVDG